MKKEIVIAVFIMFTCLYSAFAQTEADFEVDLTADGKGVVIKRYAGKALQVRIPATIQGMPVREIGDEAFSQGDDPKGPTTVYAVYDWLYPTKLLRQGITSVVIPEGVTKIGDRAFYVYENTDSTGISTAGVSKVKGSLASVTIPSTVTEIGEGAFRGQPLTSVALPKSLSKAGSSVFENYSRTVGIFEDCTNLRTVTIPEGVTVIGGGMFSGCTALASVTIPKSVASIGPYAFQESGLTSFTWPANIPIIERGENLSGMFSGCTKLARVTLPEGLTIIGSNAFTGCTALAAIALPSTIFDIGEKAFRGCTALTTVTIPESVKGIYFSGDDNGGLTTSSCPKLNLASQAAIRRVQAGTPTLVIPSGITEIKKSSISGFESYKKLINLIIPDTVTAIGDEVFYNYSSLGSVTIGKGVKSIGKNAFEYCDNLTSVTFQGTIPSSAFHAEAFGHPQSPDSIGNIRETFYAADKQNGTPGTYTREARSKTWTKQE